jgi:hypothetical protein
MNIFHTVVVVPCLNEEMRLQATCMSLGFGQSIQPPSNTTLVIVDNGSCDGTISIAKKIQTEAPAGSVVITDESERGYVPPRHRGAVIAKEIAQSSGLNESQVLILQTDADTTYNENYVDNMRRAARDAPDRPLILKARTIYPPDFISHHTSFFELCGECDAPFEHLLTDHPDDVIIDDKACGYRLSDYLEWGGHQREFTSCGDEIHSETTRLFMRAMTFACQIAFVDEAVACHSVRKVRSHPIIEFVTSGYPRGKAWLDRCLTKFSEIDSIDSLQAYDYTDTLLQAAIQIRQSHVLGLFGVLPLYITRTLERATSLEYEPWAPNVQLPRRSLDFLRQNPGAMIVEALDATEKLLSE